MSPSGDGCRHHCHVRTTAASCGLSGADCLVSGSGCLGMRGLSQEPLALESGLSRNMLMRIEWGRRGLLSERLADVAEVLGVTPGELRSD